MLSLTRILLYNSARMKAEVFVINVIFLSLVIVSISLQDIFKKAYHLKVGNRGSFIFSAGLVLSAALFFLFSSGFKLDFKAAVIPYSLGFAASYGMAVLMGFLAIKVGSLSLTSLVNSYSLIIPTFWGLFFMGEGASLFFWVGLGILFVSLFLMNFGRSGIKITLKWVVFVFLSFLGNGICSAVLTAQQKTFGGLYKSEMMITALFTVAIVLIAVAAFKERGEIKESLRGTHFMIACGVANGVCNLLVMILSVKMPASIMYPVISGGGIVITGIVSVLIYREKLSVNQYVALLLGTVSVVLMNI